MKSTSAASRATVLLFTWAAGSVDAITYLTAHVFTANMTGNAVLLGIFIGRLSGTRAMAQPRDRTSADHLFRAGHGSTKRLSFSPHHARRASATAA